jgi:hypothetical protein
LTTENVAVLFTDMVSSTAHASGMSPDAADELRRAHLSLLRQADKASLQLLRHLTATEQPLRLLVLGTYRESELSRAHPLLETLAALHRQHGVAQIEMAGFDDTGVISLMEAAAGHTLDDTSGAPRTRGVSGDRRQPILRERGSPSPVRDGRDLRRRGRAMGRSVA